MNPFSLTFGKELVNAISRDRQMNEIVEGFTAENPEFHACMITGERSCYRRLGKCRFCREF